MVLLTQQEIELPRTSRDLCEYVQRTIKAIRSETQEAHAALLKEGLYKEFRDEVTYLGLCASKIYPPTFLIQPVLGNQGYDAKVFDQDGNCVEFIELANPHDGATDARDARIAVAEGRAIRNATEQAIVELRSKLVETCRMKSQKDYSDCTLVVVADWPETVMYGAEELRAIMYDICHEVSKFSFRSKRTYIYEARGDNLYLVGDA